MNRVIQRTWSKSLISNHNEILDIWDTGSHIYERWPDGTETYWKVVSREETKSGFREVLEKMPPWQMPAQVLRREQIPLQQVSPYHYVLGSWNVEQLVLQQGQTLIDNKMASQSSMAGNRHRGGKQHTRPYEKQQAQAQLKAQAQAQAQAQPKLKPQAQRQSKAQVLS
jgi:hypothetical protein